VEASSGGGAPLMPGGGSVRRWREGRRGDAWVRRRALKVARWGGEGAREREREGRPGRRAVVADGQGRMGAPEVGDDPDRWAPPVGECVGEGRKRWAGGD
jgi:hypothetical protein